MIRTKQYVELILDLNNDNEQKCSSNMENIKELCEEEQQKTLSSPIKSIYSPSSFSSNNKDQISDNSNEDVIYGSKIKDIEFYKKHINNYNQSKKSEEINSINSEYLYNTNTELTYSQSISINNNTLTNLYNKKLIQKHLLIINKYMNIYINEFFHEVYNKNKSFSYHLIQNLIKKFFAYLSTDLLMSLFKNMKFNKRKMDFKSILTLTYKNLIKNIFEIIRINEID